MWASDGTREGTFLLKDITPGGGSSHITEIVCHSDTLFFTVTLAHRKETLRWLSDGTRRGTRLATEGDTHMHTEL